MSDAQLVTQADYARHRGVTRQQVGKDVAAGKIKLHERDGKRLIDKAEADLALGANVSRILAEADAAADAIEPRAATPGLTKARTEREQYAAQIAGLELNERLKKLRPVEDIRIGTQRCAEIMIRALDRLPARADELHAVAAKDGAHGVRSYLRGLVRDLKATASAEFSKLAAGELVDDDDDGAGEQ